MIRPQRRSIICGISAWVIWRCRVKLRVIASSHFASGASTGSRRLPPAQLTRMSTWPSPGERPVAQPRRRILGHDVLGISNGRGPWPRTISPASSSSRVPRRATAATCTPSAAKPLATARPIPMLAPVTRAVFPTSRRSIFLSRACFAQVTAAGIAAQEKTAEDRSIAAKCELVHTWPVREPRINVSGLAETRSRGTGEAAMRLTFHVGAGRNQRRIVGAGSRTNRRHADGSRPIVGRHPHVANPAPTRRDAPAFRFVIIPEEFPGNTRHGMQPAARLPTRHDRCDGHPSAGYGDRRSSAESINLSTRR